MRFGTPESADFDQPVEIPVGWIGVNLRLANRKRLVKQSFPDVLAVCWQVCVRIPKTRHDRRSFLSDPSPMDCSKGREPVALEGMRAGVFRLAGWPRSCPRLPAPAARLFSFFNGLIAWPA